MSEPLAVNNSAQKYCNANITMLYIYIYIYIHTHANCLIKRLNDKTGLTFIRQSSHLYSLLHLIVLVIHKIFSNIISNIGS